MIYRKMTEEVESQSDEELSLLDLLDPSSQSHVIVHEQMRDLVSIQEAAIANITQANVETLNASRDIFDITLRSKEEKIKLLERAITNDYIPKDKYDAVVEDKEKNYVSKQLLEELKGQLKTEKEKHAETQGALKDVTEGLDDAKKRIKMIEDEKEQTLSAFDSAYNSLRNELAEANANCNLLQSKLNEMEMVCEQQQDRIVSQQQTLEDLQQRQRTESQRYQQRLRETEVEKQQEAYLQRMMADGDQRTKRRTKKK